ncbi:hypothetical protein O4J56_20420 [Nocardiopsis sp. RSe5-2]|uniref:Uncharacterized protein n=1 Tax=Nocardiopsis endophytica TaxID=3018445 RepID=A0ABT4U7T9_9ACTN|nr:hypothetical protein [Nocardiopsis endophytica]MDA2813022.1 hypothetical protein [Nocardiopsis endophytica]
MRTRTRPGGGFALALDGAGTRLLVPADAGAVPVLNALALAALHQYATADPKSLAGPWWHAVSDRTIVVRDLLQRSAA